MRELFEEMKNHKFTYVFFIETHSRLNLRGESRFRLVQRNSLREFLKLFVESDGEE